MDYLRLVSIALLGAIPLLLSMRATPVHSAARSHVPIGPMPHNCPAGPATTWVSREFAPAAGNGPVWIVGLGGPSGFLTRHAALWYYSQSPIDFEVGFGYGHKAFFAVRPGYRQTVTIRGGNLRNGQPMLWPTLNDLDPAHPTRTRILVLTPQPGQAHSAWAQYRDGLYVPQAGCYYLEARYPGGGWRITFGAGR